MEQQQPGYAPEENPRTYTMLTNVLPTTGINNEIPHEQQIVYYNPPVNYQKMNNTQSYLYPQQVPNGQIINPLSSNYLSAQYNQQQHALSTINMANAHTQQPAMHSNMNQQQITFPSYQPSVNVIAPPLASSMINPTGSSTPILATTKRGRNDTSGYSESNVQVRPQYSQPTRVFNSSNTPNKRLRGVAHRNEFLETNQSGQNRPMQPQQNVMETRVPAGANVDEQVVSNAACRFATSRYPFAPFSVIFSQKVREKTVVEDLITHASDHWKFELKTAAYRKGSSENNEYRILIFVENSESFVFLHDQSNWPNTLADCQYTIRSPSIPPQLALVIPSVSLQIDWDEFVQEVEEKYPDIANVIRLKNKAQQPVRAVKLEFMSTNLRDEILAAGEISISYMKLKVVKYYAQANVLICSNCYGIGHFRKNCAQKNETTCKTCGEKCTSLKEHQCSGVLKCIHFGGAHVSNDAKCNVVKDYRAALTRNLLANAVSKNIEDAKSRPPATNLQLANARCFPLSYASVVQSTLRNLNEILLNKMDAVVMKIEEESSATRRSLEDLKEEMRSRYEETRKHVDMLETKVMNMEKKLEEFSLQVFTTMQNMCTSLLDPQGSQSTNWKSYWQEQIKILSECRSHLSKTKTAQ